MAVTSTLKPLLKWDKPADITYPLTVSVDVLDASVIGIEITEVDTDDDTGETIRTTKSTRTTPVPGSFSYEYLDGGTWKELSAGDKLDADTYEIRATFTFEPVGGAGFTFDASAYNSVDNGTITLIDTAGTSITYKIKNGDSAPADPANQEFDAESSATVTANNFKALVESANGHNGTINVTSSGGGVITMVQDVAGAEGYTDITTGGSFNNTCSSNPPAAFAPDSWMTVGGVNMAVAGEATVERDGVSLAAFRKLQSLLVNRGDPGLTWEPSQVDFYLLRNADCPTVPTDAFASPDAIDQGEIQYYLNGPAENSDYDPNGPKDDEKNPQYPDCDDFQPTDGYFSSDDDITLCCEIDNTVTASVTARYVPNNPQNYNSASLSVTFTVRKPKAEKPMRVFNGLVQKFSCNMGWGGDAGNLQLTLIEDPDAVDEDGEPDPALLTFPAVGTACYFLYHGFYFGGVFQRWTYSEGSSGRSYDVVITTPSSLLDGVMLVLDGFQGTAYTGNLPLKYLFPGTLEYNVTYGTMEKKSEKYQDRKGIMYESTNPYPTNVFNIFGHLENYKLGAVGTRIIGLDPVVLGEGGDPNWTHNNAIYNSGPSFGFSGINEDGINAYDTLELLQAMASTETGERLKSYVDYNGNKFNRINNFGGLIRFGDSEYELDLRALIGMMDDTAASFDDNTLFGVRRFRVQGPILDCNGLFKEVAELCQHDYFIEVQMSIFDLDYDPNDPDSDEKDGYTRGTDLLPNHYQAHDGYGVTGVGGNGGGPIGVKIDLGESKLLDDDGNPRPLSGKNKREVVWRTTEDRGVMVVQTMNRQFQPTPGQIDEFILERKKPHGKTVGKRSENAQNDIISYELGGELTQNVTQRLVWGAPASRIVDYARNQMLPVWSALPDGTPIYESPELGKTIADLSTTNANGLPIYANHHIILPMDKRGNDTYTAVLFELRMALADQTSWETFKCFQIANGNEPNGYTFPGIFVPQVDPRKSIIQRVIDGENANLLQVSSQQFLSKAHEDAAKNEASKIYNVVKKCAENFYMKQFMVPLPMEPGGRWNNQKQVADGKMVSTWEISESAWVNSPPVSSIHFFDDTGRFKTACAWDESETYDYAELTDQYAVGNAGGIYTTKASVAPELVWDWNDFHLSGHDFTGILLAHCNTNADIEHYDDWSTPNFGATTLAKLFYGLNLSPTKYSVPGYEQIQFAVPPNPVAPVKFLVPQQSTRYVWGPWYRWGQDATGQAKNGKIEVIVDDNLSPETYGSRALLGLAGDTKCGTNLALFKEQESGSVTLAQFPQWRIGARFLAAGPYVTDMEVSVGANGSTVKYGFNTWTPQFGKLAQYNLDRVAKIRRNSIQAAREFAPMRLSLAAPPIAVRVAAALKAKRFKEECKNMQFMVLQQPP